MARFLSALNRNWRDFRRPKPQLSLCMFEEGFSLNLFSMYIPLPFLNRYLRQPKEILESWGFSLCMSELHLNWGNRYKIIWMPWIREWVGETEVRLPDGSWTKRLNPWDNQGDDGRMIHTAPYKYTLRNGETQQAVATFYEERRRYRWRIFRKSRWPITERTEYSIDVRFDREMGERAGSWKGGCIGCGWTMKKGETALDTLRRMERERSFS